MEVIYTLEDCIKKCREGRRAIINDGRVLGFTIKIPCRRQPKQGLEKTISYNYSIGKGQLQWEILRRQAGRI